MNLPIPAFIPTSISLDPTSDYFFPVLILLLVTFFIFVFWVTLLIFEQFSVRIRKDEAMKRERAYQDALAVLDDAKKQSFSIISSANSRATEILSAADLLGDDAKATLANEVLRIREKQSAFLEETSSSLLEAYRHAIEHEKAENIRTLQDVSSTLKKELVSEIEEFKETLAQETISSQEMVREKVRSEYSEIEEDLKSYKEEQLKKIDAGIYTILAQVSKDVLGKALSLQDHQDLVMKSLEDAKLHESVRL